MTDFKLEAADSAEMAVNRARMTWGAWLTVWSIVFFALHLIPWLYRGHPVNRDAYHHSSAESRYLVSPEEVRLEPLYR